MFAVSIRHHESRRNVVRMYGFNTKVRSQLAFPLRGLRASVCAHFSSRVYVRVLYFHLLREYRTPESFRRRSGCVCPCGVATTRPGYGFTILYILRPRHTTRAYNGYNLLPYKIVTGRWHPVLYMENLKDMKTWTWTWPMRMDACMAWTCEIAWSGDMKLGGIWKLTKTQATGRLVGAFHAQISLRLEA